MMDLNDPGTSCFGTMDKKKGFLIFFKVTSHFTLLEYVKVSLTKLKLNIVHNNMASSRSQNEIIHHTQITRQKNLSIRRSQN